MKKSYVVTIVAVVVTYLAATWISGQVAHKRMEEFGSRFNEQAQGQLHIVKRETKRGFFGSSEDITIGLDNPVLAALLVASKLPSEITLHNDIAHGPLPGFRAFGLARIKTSLVMSDETRKSLIEVLGTDEPLAVASTLGWLGNTHVNITSPVMTIKVPNEDMTIDWKGMNLDADYSPHFDKVKMEGSAPSLVMEMGGKGNMIMEGLSINANLTKHLESLYVGDESVKFATLKLKAPNVEIDMKDLLYAIKMSANDDVYNISVNMDAGLMDAKLVKVKDIHLDFSFNHLHTATVAELAKSYQKVFSKAMQSTKPTAPEQPEESAEQAEADASDADTTTAPAKDATEQALTEEFAKHIIELLRHNPEFVVDHVGFATDSGAAKFTAKAYLEGVEDSDLTPTPDPAKLMNKLVMSGDFTMALGLLDSLPIPGASDASGKMLEQMESQGFIVKKDDQWQSHIEFKQGKLTANGKPVM